MLKQLDMFQSDTSQSVIHGDCLDIMKSMSDNSIDFIVTDPPYSLSFMGKKWDDSLPSIEIWKEALRICKPGAWMASFGSTRTYHRLTCNIEDSGWEIRDCIMWLYGSGFPKGKGCLKPAYEPIVLARKKAPNPRLNIEECRIVNEEIFTNIKDITAWKGNKFGNGGTQKTVEISESRIGRWPANLILDEEAAQELDQQTGINASRFFYCAKASSSERNRGLEGMPLKEKKTMSDFPNNKEFDSSKTQNKSGSPSPNFHPTVKPISLMKYILTLLSPPGQPTCLDPFCGSGSTLLAAKELGINCIGIEKEAEYVEIAKARIKC